jgi:bifunctional non-homologous end joining protein LigD
VLHTLTAFIVGWTAGEGNRSGKIGALVLANQKSGKMKYVGKVGTGFDHATLEQIRVALHP